MADTHDGYLTPLATDMPVNQLAEAERLSVYLIRGWVWTAKRGDPPANWLVEALARQDLECLAMPLHRLMCLVGSHASVSMDVRCPRCGRLGDGERRLLAMLASAQARDESALRRRSAAIVKPQADDAAVDLARWVAEQLLVKGRALPDRREDAPAPAALPGWQGSQPPGAVTVH